MTAQLISSAADPAEVKRLRFIRAFMLIFGIASAVISIAVYARGEHASAMISFSSFFILLIIRHYLRTVRYLHVVAYGLFTYLLVSVSFVALQGKGQIGPLFIYSSIMLMVVFIQGRKVGAIFAACTVAMLISFNILQSKGVLHSSIPTEFFGLGVINIVLPMLIMYFYDGINLDYERLLLEREEALKAEKRSVEAKVVARTKELKAAEAKLRASIEGMTLGFAVTDASGVLAIHNRALSSMFGDRPMQSMAELEQALPKFDLVGQLEIVKRHRQFIDLPEVPVGEKFYHIFIAPVLLEDKTSFDGTVILIEDVTEAKILDRSKDEFFSIASHELRTPLTAIQGNASMIQNYYAQYLKDPDMASMVSDIHESSQRLISVVHDFLDVTSLEQNKVSFELASVDVVTVAEVVIHEMKNLADAQHITVELEKPQADSIPAVWADQNRLKQVLYNLIGNAAKFTERGKITVSFATEKTMVHVRVHDTGRGMDKAKQTLLFHKFQQAGDSLLTRDTARGTGLGLYISKMIVEHMGGSIGLESSEPGQGSTFGFTVPVATAENIHAHRTGGLLTNTATGMTEKPLTK